MTTLVKTANWVIREVSLNKGPDGEWVMKINNGNGIPPSHVEQWLWLELTKAREEAMRLQEILKVYEESPQ